MKAIVCQSYGAPEVLHVKEIDTPVPGDHEVLIKSHAATVTSGDCRVRGMNMPPGFKLIAPAIFGLTKPRQPVLGSECAGEVTAAGRHVSNFKVGDRVFAFRDLRMGCYAQYVCMRDDGALALIPLNLGYDEAATLSFGGTTALSYLRRARLRRGERVLVNGASGAVGIAAVQLAKHYGAVVTGVCSSANAELVKSLGATQVIDYTQSDFTRSGELYDVIVDTAGTAPFSRSRNSLKAGGRLLMVLSGLPDLLKAPWISMMGDKKIIAGPATANAEDMQFLSGLAATGEFKAVIDRRYPLEQIAEAHRYVDSGRKKGNVVITLAQDA